VFVAPDRPIPVEESSAVGPDPTNLDRYPASPDYPGVPDYAGAPGDPVGPAVAREPAASDPGEPPGSSSLGSPARRPAR
jgi:hypothetical protein